MVNLRQVFSNMLLSTRVPKRITGRNKFCQGSKVDLMNSSQKPKNSQLKAATDRNSDLGLEKAILSFKFGRLTFDAT